MRKEQAQMRQEKRGCDCPGADLLWGGGVTSPVAVPSRGSCPAGRCRPFPLSVGCADTSFPAFSLPLARGSGWIWQQLPGMLPRHPGELLPHARQDPSGAMCRAWKSLVKGNVSAARRCCGGSGYF